MTGVIDMLHYTFFSTGPKDAGAAAVPADRRQTPRPAPEGGQEMRMVGYGRVSTDHEEQRDSLEHQQAFFQDFARPGATPWSGSMPTRGSQASG